MQNKLFRKALVLGIIILFIGASVIPSISGNFSKIAKIDGSRNHQNTVTDNIETNSNGGIVLDFSFDKPLMEKVIILQKIIQVD